ncbi:MAG: hypothetical protein LBP59_06050 [Planctomycetaceae bacterium]|nr:hypothetical protein [Planctomycetaceae bacterium]
MRKLNLCILLIFVALIFVGCGNPRVSGKVVFSDDKSPVPYGMVNFVTDKTIARGPIDKNGNYVVGSLKARDGLPPGEYKVYITDTMKVIPPSGNSGMPKFEMVIHSKYEKPETSGLVLNVKGSQVFNIEVDRYDPSTETPKKGKR